jgi:hypothetical protein
MAKKKEQEPKFQDVVGTPTPMMLPARNYKFRVYDEEFSVTIPRKGKYVDLDAEMYTEEDGEFDLMQYSRKDKAQIIYLPTLSRVLFATAQYPDIKDTQAFTPIALIIKKDVVEVIGHLIEMTKEN